MQLNMAACTCYVKESVAVFLAAYTCNNIKGVAAYLAIWCHSWSTIKELVLAMAVSKLFQVVVDTFNGLAVVTGQVESGCSICARTSWQNSQDQDQGLWILLVQILND